MPTKQQRPVRNLLALRLADMLDGGVRILTETLNGRPVGLRVPDDWQVECLDAHRADDIALLISRQAGKSELMAAAALHAAACYPGTSVGVLAATEVAALRIIEKVRGGLHAVPYVQSTNNAAARMTFSNGSSIEAFAAGNPSSIRGQTFGNPDWASYGTPILGLVVDEAAFVGEDAWQAATPTTDVNSARTITGSTPGLPGLFKAAITGDDPGWHRVIRPADMCPRLTPAVLAKARKRLGDRRFSIEYLLQWDQGGASRVFDDPAALLGLGADDPADDEPQFESLTSRLARLKGKAL